MDVHVDTRWTRTGIARALEPTGIDMFVRMFQETPDVLSVFSK